METAINNNQTELSERLLKEHLQKKTAKKVLDLVSELMTYADPERFYKTLKESLKVSLCSELFDSSDNRADLIYDFDEVLDFFKGLEALVKHHEDNSIHLADALTDVGEQLASDGSVENEKQQQ